MTVERIDVAWAAFFGLSPQAFLEPGRAALLPVGAHPAGRALFAADTAALRQLAAACDADAWEDSGITFDDPHLFGLIVDGLVVAAARGRPGWGETAHVGVVTHPDHRGRGFGRAVVSATTAQALAEGLIVLYQTPS
jgi:GNAT superfamily N-acetyltransferase